MHQAFVAPPIRPTFGVDLGEQMLRDNVEVPRVLEKCCEAIELHGLESMGIYRLSGTTSRVQRLKGKLDRGLFRFHPSVLFFCWSLASFEL